MNCTWTYDEDLDTWDTECGESFVVTNGTPAENKMRFCPYCGSPIIEEMNNDSGESDARLNNE